MFGKRLRQELKGYVRWLWPFAIGVVASCALACWVTLTDDQNPSIDSPIFMAIAIFVMAALAIVVRTLIHAYVSFRRKLRAVEIENERDLMQLLWVSFVAFMIVMALITLLVIAGVTSFAWEAVGQKFLAFATEWLYFVEFVFFFVIFVGALYIIPNTWSAVYRFGKQIKWRRVLSMVVGIIIFVLCYALVVYEIMLLIHDTSTNMQGLWATIIIMLFITALVDIGMFLLTRNVLKDALIKSNTIDE